MPSAEETRNIHIDDVLKPERDRTLDINSPLSLTITIENIDNENTLINTVCKTICEKVLGISSDAHCQGVIKEVLELFKRNNIDSRIRSIKGALEGYLSIASSSTSSSSSPTTNTISSPSTSTTDAEDFVNRVKRLNEVYKEYSNDSRVRANRNAKKKLQNIAPVFLGSLNIAGNEPYIKKIFGAVRELVNGGRAKNGAIVLDVYLKLLSENYRAFDDVEWFLVLVNRWAKNRNTLLPLCPTKEDLFLLIYAYVYATRMGSSSSSTSSSTGYNVGDVVDLLKYLLGIVGSSSTST